MKVKKKLNKNKVKYNSFSKIMIATFIAMLTYFLMMKYLNKIGFNEHLLKNQTERMYICDEPLCF